MRSYDVVMRYGGDEFVCALPRCPLAEVEARFIELASALSQASAVASFSIGVAELLAQDTLDDVIRRADADMYERRRTRRNCLFEKSCPCPEVCGVCDGT